MIYGDWEEAYDKLPALFNAIKEASPGMHYESIPNLGEWRNRRQIFFRASWCFPQCVEAFRHCRLVLSIDGTFLLGKYMGTLLVAIVCDADNTLILLAYALVERENKDRWEWFFRNQCLSFHHNISVNSPMRLLLDIIMTVENRGQNVRMVRIA